MKGLNDFLSEDSSLTEKITYDEFKKEKKGFDDTSIEEAYEAYKNFKEERN